MHMKNKSIKRICCTIISTITIMGTALGVSADTADKLYTFSLYTSEANTGSYYKDNSSSVYVNPTMSPANGVQFAGYRYDGATWYNETIGGWAYIAAGTKRRLRTNIYENAGYKRTLCRLSGKLLSGGSPYEGKIARGYWSPDTAVSYPAAN